MRLEEKARFDGVMDALQRQMPLLWAGMTQFDTPSEAYLADLKRFGKSVGRDTFAQRLPEFRENENLGDFITSVVIKGRTHYDHRAGRGILPFIQAAPEAFDAALAKLLNRDSAPNVPTLVEAVETLTAAMTVASGKGPTRDAIRRPLQSALMYAWPQAWIEFNITRRSDILAKIYGRGSERSSDIPHPDDVAACASADLEIGRDVFESFKARGCAPQDLIDVHTLLWVGLESLDDKARGGASPAQQPASAAVRTNAALNTILYGPPGTGKTYATASRAVAICDGAAPADRADLMARYEDLRREGRIEFITFHQSYGYEDFVEGLRPQTGAPDEDDAPGGPGFRLVAEDGVLKRIARRAAEARPHGEDISALQRKTVFKIALGANTPAMDHVRDRCFEEGRIMFGASNPVDWSPQEYIDFAAILARLREDDPELSGHSSAAIEPWLMRGAIKEGDIAVVSAGQSKVLAIGEVTGPYEFNADEATADGGMHQRRVRWLRIFDAPLDADEIYGGALHRATLCRLDKGKIKWERLASLLGDPDAPPPPHVLIIDEINRANVSKVMGELITLLEEDKRAGAVNALTVTLPFSKDSFSLPANLHILGAMNTADRSIALLDTALRRRFRFEHLGPDPSVLSVVGGVDLPAALRAMNDRLEWLLGPDHLIGHAWFMGAEVSDLGALDRAMRDKVIPLLREYFHEDLSRVRAVLGAGDGFLRREKLASPPGIDDGYEDRHRFVDAWDAATGYGPAAWAQLIGAAPA